MSRSSNQKRKRKARVATGVPETVHARALRRWRRLGPLVSITATDATHLSHLFVHYREPIEVH